MVEGGSEVDVVVVEAIGVERDVSVGGAAAEEVDCAAFADEFDGLLPGLGHADGLNGDVDAAILGVRARVSSMALRMMVVWMTWVAPSWRAASTWPGADESDRLVAGQ